MDANIAQNPGFSATRLAIQELQSIYKDQMASSSSQEQINEKTRQAIIATARDLTTSSETPLESILWMAWAEVRKSSIPFCAT